MSALQTAPKARRLTTIARWINENMPGYVAKTEATVYNTDRHPKGVCWRIPGKGRKGVILTVRRENEVVFRHNSGETYRCNEEVERWLARELGKSAQQGACHG